MRFRHLLRHSTVTVVMAGLLIAPSLSAQVPTARPSYTPAAITFDTQGLSLLEAVRLTLENDPNIKLQEADVDHRTGVVRGEAGRFDSLVRAQASLQYVRTPLSDTAIASQQQVRDDLDAAIRQGANLQQQRNALGATPSEIWSREGTLRLDFTRQARSGLAVTPFADLQYTDTNYAGKDSWDPLNGGYGVKPTFQGRIGFEVAVPFARGRGAASVAAAEAAAKQDLEASRLLLLQQTTESVLSTVLAYWDTRAASEQVEVLQRSVDLQSELAKMVRALIAANERARADETRVQASLGDAQARLQAAERHLTETRVILARTMGVALANPQAIPLAADPFPRPAETLQVDASLVAAFASQAAERRHDRHAALRSVESSRITSVAAGIDTKPLVDATVSGWGTTVNENRPGFSNWSVASGSAGLQYERPVGNTVALGRLDQSVAALKRSDIDSTDLARRIVLDVTRDAQALHLATERLRTAEEAVRNYEQTIKDEQAKLRSGDSTLLDTILTEQQTTAARLALVSARQDYATLVARLRFEAGLLVQDTEGKSAVTLENLVGVPAGLVRR